MNPRIARALAAGGCSLLVAGWPGAARTAQPEAGGRRLIEQADRRILELQAESERLAGQARTLLNELRALEIERAIRAARAQKAEAALAGVEAAREAAAARLAGLEARRIAATPGVTERLVEIYQRRRGGYLRMLFQSGDPRALGRVSRGVAALRRLDRLRFDTHRAMIRAERQALEDLESRRKDVAAAQDEAARARNALDAAVAAHTRRIDELDRRRDLAAQYVGELQRAQAELQKRVTGIGADAPALLPLRPFRGALPWPASGRLVSRFGRGPTRFGSSVIRNGVEIATTEGQPVRAVHDGAVAHAAPFEGFGTLVILDHGGGGFSLYGHLADAAVAAGAPVERGAVVGRAGRNPEGVNALYFELRIDGQPVDPLQWLGSPR